MKSWNICGAALHIWPVALADACLCVGVGHVLFKIQYLDSNVFVFRISNQSDTEPD